jgi:hypothetical protein
VPQQEPHQKPATAATLPPATFADSERQAMGQQVETITNNVVLACREAVKVAQDLEALVVENAARVKTELDEHVALAGAVKGEAAKLADSIRKLRDAQAAVALHRKNGNGQAH